MSEAESVNIRSVDLREDAAASSPTPSFRYSASIANEIEERWQARWENEGTFHAPNPVGELSPGFERLKNRPKFYMLDMFPYLSGSGLHVGHPVGYIGTDVLARFLRMTGRQVLHTLGYDSFGLPAEQYAINTGQHPQVTVADNIAIMRRQLRRLGLGHDSRREVATSDVSFYRWTQWIFLKIFESWYDKDAARARPITELVSQFASGQRQPVSSANPDSKPWADLSEIERRSVIDSYRLAYLSEELVNWCPGLGTVLANEEVTADGRSDVGNFPVHRRPLRQWMMRITSYADRLIADLDGLDWPESIKAMQRNWIGRSEGVNVAFPVAGADNDIEVFTTRPDTLFGATYMVLAPEHPLVDEITAEKWPFDVDVRWSGGEVTPARAVAAYREAAARKSEMDRQENRDKTGVFTGSYATNPVNGRPIPVFVADYVLMGYGTRAIMAVPAQDQRDWDFATVFGLPIVRTVQPPEDFDGDAYVGDGPAINSANDDVSLNGMDVSQAKASITRWLAGSGSGEPVAHYKLRDWAFSRQRYWGEPFPIVYDETDLPIGLPERMLPIELPEMSDFRPAAQAKDDVSDPVPPLARVAGWADVELDLGDGLKRYRRETNTMPQWAGSCWYYLRYLDPTNTSRFVDEEVEQYWMNDPDTLSDKGGVDLYVGGVEHAVLHLLYARFWHKVLYDLGELSTEEPFMRLFNQGYILADAYVDQRGIYVPAIDVVHTPGGGYTYQDQPVSRRAGKMGKSLKNGVSPDEIYAIYGADTLRLYEMAMGPLDTDKPWRTDDMVGYHRFLQRLWRNLVDEHTGEARVVDCALDRDGSRHLNQTVAAVRADYANLRFNTAVARLIELTNYLAKRFAPIGTVPRKLAEPIVLMLAPLAPHISEELWERLGHTASLAYHPFPESDASLAAEDTVILPVQVNGKVRFKIEVPTGAGEAKVRAALATHEEYDRYTDGKEVQRLIVVPGRIVSIELR